jgi:cell division protein FtsL
MEVRSYLLYVAVAFALAVALSWSYSTAARLGYHINELKSEIAALERERESLSYQLSSLTSMARIEAEATGRLGMVHPDKVRTGSPVGSLTGTGSDREHEVARVISLAPPGDGPFQADGIAAVLPEGGRSLMGSLWERFYRWLTGVSLAEAKDWD